MYRRPKFLEILHEIREEMSAESDYDVDLFAENVRSGKGTMFNIIHLHTNDKLVLTQHNLEICKSPLK